MICGMGSEMTSLEKSASRMHDYGRTIYDIYTNDETRKRWAKAYIKEIEEHMVPWILGQIPANVAIVAAKTFAEVMRLMKGENGT